MSLTAEHIKDARKRIAYQFELEAARLNFAVERILPNYRYIVQDLLKGGTYTAMVLRSSFDFYEFRLNRGKRRVDMLIVERHNAVVPVRVVSLTQIKDYPPLDVPEIARPKAKRRNAEEVNLLLSKLILNFESAEEEISKMDPRTQQRYYKRKQAYLNARIGRPWAS
jgi:hypothetical protein